MTISIFVFSAIITGGTFNFFEPESLGSYYDYLAQSMLDLRLDVPEAAIANEAMVFEGKYYGYFGPTPALLRLPFVWSGLHFGRLTRLFMVGYFALFLTGVYVLLVTVNRYVASPERWPRREHVLLLVFGAGVGSSALFLSSRAYLYHESILSGVAFATWSVCFTLRWFQCGGVGSGWIFALIGGILAVNARATTGLFALATLGSAAAYLLIARLLNRMAWSFRSLLRPLLIGALAIAGLLTLNVISYLKFHTFESIPLRYHIAYTPDRLENSGGKLFNVDNIPYNAVAYMLPYNLQLRANPPYLFLHSPDPADFPESSIDYVENTIPLPVSMPHLLFLVVLAYTVTWSRFRQTRRLLAILLGGLLPMALALFAYFAQAHRYTADFLPFLVASGSFGLVGIEVLKGRLQKLARVLILISTLLGGGLALLVTTYYQVSCVWGVAPDIQKNHHRMREWIEAWRQ